MKTFEEFKKRYEFFLIEKYNYDYAFYFFKLNYPVYQDNLTYNYYIKKRKDEGEFEEMYPGIRSVEKYLEAFVKGDFERCLENY